MPNKKTSRRVCLSRETLHNLTEPVLTIVSTDLCCSHRFKCFNTLCPTCVTEF